MLAEIVSTKSKEKTISITTPKAAFVLKRKIFPMRQIILIFQMQFWEKAKTISIKHYLNLKRYEKIDFTAFRNKFIFLLVR